MTAPLTRAEIIALTPEQLRLQVAELMGWKRQTWTSGIFLCHAGYPGVAGAQILNNGIRFFPAMPNYPAKIAAAWMVLEAAYRYTVTKDYGVYEVIYTICVDDENHTGYANEPDLCVAICRAALLAQAAAKGETE